MTDTPKDGAAAPAPGPSDSTLGIFAALSTARAIGPYRLLELVGEGGMGEVWRAEQVEPIHRTAAIKLIKAGMDTKAVIARFESERQALALMEHPCIAKVFDAGSTAEGRPYFVMEYVPGLPITEYSDKHRLTLKQRLGLFTQVCEGVQHAHQKAIIHRDLKPSNVLVLQVDDKPVPKIIDFGLAKATGPRLTEATLYTEVGTMVGTPAYMSPEQADRDERNIDTRTDVYSLGVILYELLAGVLPFEEKELREAGLDAMLKKIRDAAPPRPSTKVRSSATMATTAELRREEPQALIRHLRGELDWIVMKALEKDRTRRYGSPSEMAADIQRYLVDEPVLAGPPSTVYRARKFVRRHRFGVAAAGTLVVLLIAFAAVMAMQARRIARERDRANREAETSRRVSEFMTSMFKVSDPTHSRGNVVTAREILDQASREIETGLAQDPELQARLMMTMGNTYQGLGLYPQAEDLFKRALEIDRRALGPENRQTLLTMSDLGWAVAQRGGHDADSEKIVREALDKQRRSLGPDDKDTLATQDVLASILKVQGRFADAEQLERETLASQRRVLGPQSLPTIANMDNLANTLVVEDKYAEAEQLMREALDITTRVYGHDHPANLVNLGQLGDILKWQGHNDEAERLEREAYDGDRRIFGKDHPITLAAGSLLASILDSEDKVAEAQPLYRETFEAQRRTLGKSHRDTLNTEVNLAGSLVAVGKYKEGEELYREAYEMQRGILGEGHPDTLYSLGGIAMALSHQHRYPEAKKLFQQEVALAEKSEDQTPLNVAWYQFSGGAAAAGQSEEALTCLQNALDKGMTDAVEVVNDKELSGLQGDPRFKTIVEEMKKRAGKKEGN